MAMSGAYVGDSESGGVLADAFYAKGQTPTTFIGTVKTLLQSFTPTRKSQELAEIWIPLNATDSTGKPYFVATCPDCFRTFPVPLAPVGSPNVITSSCFFCSFPVKYKNDFSRILTLAGIAKAKSPTDSQEIKAAAVEASVGAFEDEIASQVPFI
jgi:hypothetical protein